MLVKLMYMRCFAIAKPAYTDCDMGKYKTRNDPRAQTYAVPNWRSVRQSSQALNILSQNVTSTVLPI